MSAAANWIAAGKTAPILYLPLSDPTQPGKNLGTGGDFTLNGVVARSGRGPSQFNAPYSDLDGSADYLSRTSLTGVADGKQFTFACSFYPDSTADSRWLIGFYSGQSLRFYVSINSDGYIRVAARNTTDTTILNITNNSKKYRLLANNHVAISVDMADINKTRFYINGQSTTLWSEPTLINDDINFNIAITPLYRIGANGLTQGLYDGRLGNVFFDTKYIDLSQPANLAKFVTGTGIDAKPADLGANGEKPFGTPPLIYLPMYGNNAGKNYGTGGDFTVFT